MNSHVSGNMISRTYIGGNFGANATPTASETTSIIETLITNPSLRIRPWNENGLLNMDQPTFTKK